MNPTTPPLNKHQERSIRTRELLLDATIDSLIELGYDRTSTTEIATRAGLSRGAALHQFSTKAELFAHAADHLAQKQIETLNGRAEEIPSGSAPVTTAVDLIFDVYAGPLGKASLELFRAAGDDAQIADHMLAAQRRLAAETLAICSERVAPKVAPDELEKVFWLTINLIRGLTIGDMMGRSARRRAGLVEAWKELAARV